MNQELAGGPGPLAAEELVVLLYGELRKLAHAWLGRAPASTLTATALVHEAVIRLINKGDFAWENRAQFFKAAVTTMRRIYLDYLDAKHTQKRGGHLKKCPLDAFNLVLNGRVVESVALTQALDALRESDERKYWVVMFMHFGGFSQGEIAEILDIDERSVRRDWKAARALLAEALADVDRSGNRSEANSDS